MPKSSIEGQVAAHPPTPGPRARMRATRRSGSRAGERFSFYTYTSRRSRRLPELFSPRLLAVGLRAQWPRATPAAPHVKLLSRSFGLLYSCNLSCIFTIFRLVYDGCMPDACQMRAAVHTADSPSASPPPAPAPAPGPRPPPRDTRAERARPAQCSPRPMCSMTPRNSYRAAACAVAP